MLVTAVRKALSENALVDKDAFVPFPPIADRTAWNSVDPEVRAYYQGAAMRYFEAPIPVLPAIRYLDFSRDGNRSRFEALYFDRRRALHALLMAECLENNGKYMESIVNLVWAICEESSWVIPAHIGTELPDIENVPYYIDLFSAETGSVLAWTLYFLRSRLDAYSPLIARRVELEISRRILTPYLQRDDMRWMGLNHDRPVNNWNPWINSNVLACALLLETNEDRRARLANKVAASTQRFLDFYREDGGCDEGPAYFNVAGASVLDVLELFDIATNGKATVYHQPLIQNMARYIMYAHVSGPYHINFADASPRVSPDAMLLRRAAIRMGLNDLQSYAEGALSEGFADCPYRTDNTAIYRRIRNTITYHRKDFENAQVSHTLSHSFPGIQVAFARENYSGSGLYFAAKGGCNGESHNHNDIGNYIIYLDGEPALCDAGVETYRRETFNAERYNIWTMQSRYHNTVILGGSDQRPGTQYAASGFFFEDAGISALFRVDMAGAYGEDAHVTQYQREIILNRSMKEITVQDRFELNEAIEPIVLPLICANEPRLAPGEIQIPAGKQVLRMNFDENSFSVSVKKIELTDSKLRSNWEKDALYRVLLTRKTLSLSGEILFRFKA